MTAPRPLKLNPLLLRILLALVRAPKHGYLLLQSLEGETGRLQPSSLYWSLGQLERAGLVRETSAPRGVESDDARRRYWTLTKAGRDRLREELGTMRSLLAHESAREILRSGQ